MTKTLLIVSGGVEAADAAKRAKELGYTVVVSDRDPEAPGFAFADSCLIADVYGPEETVRRGGTLSTARSARSTAPSASRPMRR